MQADQNGLNILTSLSTDGQKQLSNGMIRHRFGKGEPVVEKGQAVSGAYLVESGRLRVYTLTPAGKEATLYFLRRGEACVLTLNSLFNNLLYPAWVQAEVDTVIGVVSGDVFRALFSREKSVQRLTVNALATVVLRLMEELEQVHSHRLDQRLASFLLNNADSKGAVFKTQQELAGHIGTTRVVVARLMCQLSDRGIIETGRGRVRVRDVATLASVFRGETSLK